MRHLLLPALVALVPALGQEVIAIDGNAALRPFPHMWEQVIGSGRANLSLRESWRADLKSLRNVTSIRYVRFHGIFDDENGVYDVDAQGRPVYNWSYVDLIYDGLLENGVRPFVELGFMPAKLAKSQTPHPFWYKPLPNPPADYKRWGDLIEAFTRHLVARYGLEEVSHWYFEVWNEPNIDFWSGVPKNTTYFELYDNAAKRIKLVSPRLRVGGPATAQAAWVDQFLAHCQQKKTPVDFVSSHVYGNDSSQDVFGSGEKIPRREMVYRAMKKVQGQVRASAFKDLPIHWTEYNATYLNDPAVTDSPFMGPYLANQIRLAAGVVTTMAYWCFSDVFEEQGIVKMPFYGGYGLIAERGIPKASYNAFALLHRLGNQRIPVESENALVTRRNDGGLAIALWNYAEPEEAGAPRQFRLEFKNLAREGPLRLTVVDRDHGSAFAAWEKMGKPAFPTREQIAELRRVAELPPAKNVDRDAIITLGPRALALIESPRQ